MSFTEGVIFSLFCSDAPQNDQSTNSVKVIGGDELSALTGKVSFDLNFAYFLSVFYFYSIQKFEVCQNI